MVLQRIGSATGVAMQVSVQISAFLMPCQTLLLNNTLELHLRACGWRSLVECLNLERQERLA